MQNKTTKGEIAVTSYMIINLESGETMFDEWMREMGKRVALVTVRKERTAYTHYGRR
jgi:hypothetical protein